MATVSWLGGNGDWSTAADWSGGDVPGAADDVTIDTAGPYTVTITGAETAHSLTLNTNVTLDIGENDQGAGALTLEGNMTLGGGAVVYVGGYETDGTLAVGGNLTLGNDGMDVGNLGGDGIVTVGGNLTIGSNSGMDIDGLGGVTVGGNLNLASGSTGLQLEGTLTADGAVNVWGGDFDLDGGVLNLGGILRVAGGSFDLDGGTINGGVIIKAGGVVQWGSGTLSGVTCYGSMNVRGDLSIIGNGLILKGPGGQGPDVINLVSGVLDLQGAQTLDNATINMSAGGGSPAEIDTTGADGTLTLGADLIVDVRTRGSISGNPGDGVINQGAINVLTRGALTIGSAQGTLDFINLGTITIAERASIYFQATDFTNAVGAVITGEANSQLTFGAAAGSWSNAGTITADRAVVTFDSPWSSNSGTIDIENSTINFNNDLTTADLTPFEHRNDSIYIGGTLDNDGAVLAVGAGSGLETVIAHGTISGGTIQVTGTGVVWNGTLDGVIIDGTLDQSNGGVLTITDKGLIVNGADGVSPGLVDLSGGGELDFEGTQTFDNATIAIGGGAVFADDTNGAGAILTLGANLTINQIGMTVQLGSDYDVRQNREDGIINQGTINATFSGGTFLINSLNFTNLGTITVANGDTLDLSPGNFTNLARGVLTGGVYEVEAGSTLQLANNLEVTTDNAVIILSGANSVIESFDTQTASQLSIDSTLTNITAKGILEILDGRDFTSTNAIDNLGSLVLEGGTFTTGRLTDARGSTLRGYGVVASTFVDQGNIVSTGVLSFSGAGDSFYGALSGGEIDFAAGSDTLRAGSSLTARVIGVETAAVVHLAANQSVAGAWRQSGGTVSLGGFDLTLSGVASLAGLIGGAGGLVFAGGTESLLAGGRLTSTSWSISGDAIVTVKESLRYAGAVSENSSTITIFASDTLSLAGAATFAGLTVTGAGSLSLVQATFNGDNVIGATTVVTGSVEVASGNLHFTRAIDGNGALGIEAGAVLDAGAAASASLTIDFAGTGATLGLGSAKLFLSTISGFAAGDTIDLIDTAATGATLQAGDKLVIVDGAKTIATLNLSGDYAGDTFNVTSDGSGGSDITLSTKQGEDEAPNVALFAQQLSAFAGKSATSLSLGAVSHVTTPTTLATPVFNR